MTRIALWALSTLSVLVLLLGYHTSTVGPSAASSPPAVYSGTVAGTTGTTGSSSSSGSSGSSVGSSGAGAATAATSFTGDTAQTQWGPVQVQLTVADGTITGVDVLQYPTGNGRDAEINAYALPRLVQSTLDVQGAGIDMVSGATVTSVGYEQSLQSALDQAGL